MAEEHSLFDFPSKKQNEGLTLWNNRKTSPEAKVTGFLSEPAPVGCCEFVEELVASGCEGRYCSYSTFCPSRIFANVKVFVGCPTRREKLKTKQGT